jgi:hypothetical protein
LSAALCVDSLPDTRPHVFVVYREKPVDRLI